MKFQMCSSFAGHKFTDKHDAIPGIGEDALAILDRMRSDDADTVKAAMAAHLRLVDWFYRENEDMLAEQQYEAAKKDVEYFLRLVYPAME